MCALPAKDWQRLQERIDRERGVHVQISEFSLRIGNGNFGAIATSDDAAVAFLATRLSVKWRLVYHHHQVVMLSLLLLL